ncbi:MAG: GNAT family protein [Thermoplasmata archaeon]
MILGKKTKLVQVSMDYLQEYKRWINDPEVSDMLGLIGFPLSTDRERKWVEENIAPTESKYNFTILTRKGKPIGNITLREIDYVHRCATLGIMIGEKEYWDRGYGSDAIDALLGFAFDTLAMHRVELRALELNRRALECYKKCGFRIEGRRRKHWYYKGKYIDDVLMGILSDEWRKSHYKTSK